MDVSTINGDCKPLAEVDTKEGLPNSTEKVIGKELIVMDVSTINGDCKPLAEVDTKEGLLNSTERDPSTNPISELHELIQKQKRQLPVFTFLHFLEKGIFPTFRCEVTVDGQSTYAEAKNKKQAKTAAAKKLLQLLRDAELNSMDTTDGPQNRFHYIGGDPISKLQELMQQQKRELPVYTFMNTQSDKDILFKCVLTVEGQSTYGEAISKKRAKYVAAAKFLESLHDAEVKSRDTPYTQKPALMVNNIGGGPSTNPIARLQELMQQLGQPFPVYAFINCRPEQSHPTFRCVVTANSQSVCAKGKTKKEAKNAAAEKFLQSLQVPVTDSRDIAHSPDLRVNYIGSLQIFCQQSRKHPPQYQVVQSDTIPVTFEVTLTVGDVVSVAKATRKKDAMQYAAKELLNKLNLLKKS